MGLYQKTQAKEIIYKKEIKNKMEMEKMRKINKVESFKSIENKRKFEKVERINLSYLDFLKEIENIEIGEDKKEDIIKLYENIVSLRFNNMRRIDFRVKREELRNELIKELEIRNLEINKFFEISKKVVNLSKEKEDNSNYLSIKI